MAGGLVKYRHLSRNSAHRQALLRNLVTSLVRHESIQTTWPKAKEAQRVADKLITLAKRNNETSRRKVQGILYKPQELMPKVFNELRLRYQNRPGGYTRVLRTEPKSTYDQAPSALLEFVDSPKDTRLYMTASAVLRERTENRPSSLLTKLNRRKVTRFRENGQELFEGLVEHMRRMQLRKSQSQTAKKQQKEVTGGTEESSSEK